MNKKELYEQPSVLVFTLQTEGVICQSVPGGTETGDIIPGAWDSLL